jgi:hypothetical protein
VDYLTSAEHPDEVKNWQAERAKHPDAGPMAGENNPADTAAKLFEHA